MVERKRKNRKKRITQGIKLGVWKKYFKGILGGVDWRVRKGEERVKGMEDEEGEISREELDRVLKKLKGEKAAGGDGIVNEV